MDRIIETDDPRVFIEEMEKLNVPGSRRINADTKNVEKGLVKLVLALVELIRGLIEKQAIKRIESGSLSDEEIERIGETLMKLENKMQELKEIFQLKDEDLSLNLGPLRDLI